MDRKEIGGCLDAEGKLKQLPAKRKKKIMALVWLADQIPQDAVFSEKEFNAFLNTLHSFGDPATLRRELYDYFQIDREPDGSAYRLNPERPGTEELFERYCK